MNATELLLHDERRKDGRYYISSTLVTEPYLAPLQGNPNTNGYSRTTPNMWPTNSSYTTGTNSDFYDVNFSNSANSKTAKHGKKSKFSQDMNRNSLTSSTNDNNYNNDKLSDLQNDLIKSGKLFLTDGIAANKVTNDHVSTVIDKAYIKQKNNLLNHVNVMNKNTQISNNDINKKNNLLTRKSISKEGTKNDSHSYHDTKKINLFDKMGTSIRYKADSDDFSCFDDIPEYTKGDWDYHNKLKHLYSKPQTKKKRSDVNNKNNIDENNLPLQISPEYGGKFKNPFRPHKTTEINVFPSKMRETGFSQKSLIYNNKSNSDRSHYNDDNVGNHYGNHDNDHTNNNNYSNYYKSLQKHVPPTTYRKSVVRNVNFSTYSLCVNDHTNENTFLNTNLPSKKEILESLAFVHKKNKISCDLRIIEIGVLMKVCLH